MKKQLELDLYNGRHGGRRPGAGRPRKNSPGVSHDVREKVTSRTPLHINFKYKAYIQNQTFLQIFEAAVINAKIKGLNVTHFSIQSNHVHIIGETINNVTLESGMKSLTRTISKSLRKGSVQLERYHLHVLKTPREVQNALSYVMNNDIKHTGKMNKNFANKIADGNSWLLKSSKTPARF